MVPQVKLTLQEITDILGQHVRKKFGLSDEVRFIACYKIDMNGSCGITMEPENPEDFAVFANQMVNHFPL